MSYNVSAWRTKKLVDLRIPLASLYKSEAKDWHPTRTNNDDGTVTFDVMEDGTEIHGTIENDVVLVQSISASGEVSGAALHKILEPALRDSTGTLVATRVWEGGDSIDKLTVIDGQVESEEIEL